MLKDMLYGYHRYHFFEQYTRSNCMFSSKMCYTRQSLFIIQTRTSKHKKSPLFCINAEGKIFRKLRQLRMKTYHLSKRIISLSGDVESNPGPANQHINNSVPSTCTSPTNSISLLETRLSQLDRTALDVGGDGDCFFRAVSHQLYGNPNNHFYVRRVGIQYLVHNSEQFIESNTEQSWQNYLQTMSCQGTWADAIIIQAVANCFNLSIHITESNPTFSPVTIVEPMNVTDSINIYIGHLDEIHYVSTLQNQSLQSTNNSNRAQNANANENKSVDNNENCEAYKRGYMRQYMKKRRADEKEKRIETKRNAKNSEHMMEINKTVVRKSKADNPEHVREINKKAVRKRKAENPEHIREINKKAVRKSKAENPEHIREINKKTVRKRKAENPEHIREINKKTVRKCKADNPEYIREINKKAVRKHKADNPEYIREINKKAVRKRKAENPKHVREINKKTVRKRKASNPQQIKDRNRNSPKRLTTVTNLNTTSTTSRLIETPCYGLARSSPLISSSAKLEQQITKCNAISMIHLFHKNIASGPEYVCTCCDQLWYRCSVVKCDANKYKTCSPEIVESCLTGFKSVDNTEWICITCDSNLKKGKLPGCSKANKMGFPHKPDVLNLTSLED